MDNLARFDSDGIEIFVNKQTGESFASISALARMTGKAASTIQRFAALRNFELQKAQIVSVTGLKTVALLDENQIIEVLEKYNTQRLKQLAKLGIRTALHKIAGFEEITSTPKKRMVTLFELSDRELGRLYAYLLSLERGITPDEELMHGISRVYLQATSGAVIYAYKWSVKATAKQKKLTEETLQNIGWCKYDRREINKLQKAVVDAEKAISSIQNESFWLRYKSECYDFEGNQADIAEGLA